MENTLTNNGALTHSTSLNAVVDMFFLAGASREMSEKDIPNVWNKAYKADPLLAMRCLFRSRDIRGGAGERRFFRIIRQSLSTDITGKYQDLVPEYGRRDDLFETSLDFVSEKFKTLVGSTYGGLLAKWTPRKGYVFEYLRVQLGLKPKEFRRLLVDNTKVVEQQMSAKEWDKIEYNHVPSQAFQKYKKAFQRNDTDRFTQFIETKPEQVKSSTLFPYQLYQSYHKGENSTAIIAQRNNLPNYVPEGKSFLPMCDVSGSMSGTYGERNSLTPMDISVSLGVYLSERNQSVFKDAFITFSGKPKMQYLKGNVVEKFRQLECAERSMDTNLQAAFDLILDTALKNALPESDMPETLLIISDMEFNEATYKNKTNFEAIRLQYEKVGYKMPNIVFWNVHGRVDNTPVQYDTNGTALVSGASPAIMKGLLAGEDFTPVAIMLKTLNSERYSLIS